MVFDPLTLLLDIELNLALSSLTTLLPRLSKITNSLFRQVVLVHCSFLVPDNTQKILTEILHRFWLKNDDEKWSKKIILKFHDGLQTETLGETYVYSFS